MSAGDFIFRRTSSASSDGAGVGTRRSILIVLSDRFLRARKFDLVKAKIMLISAEQWRKDEQVDEIAKCEFPARLLSR